MKTNPVFDTLEPQAVWRHFATLCAIPRPSKHEGALMRHLRDWANARGIAARSDAAGNLVLTKPAAPGRENAPGVILQGHVDMVCECDSCAAGHDFHRHPILPEMADGWLVARHTTLGADNGVGVALALAAAEDSELPHGPLEILLTVDEEAGMGGARHLEAGSLRGRFLLNLDTEEWGAFYLGCAGGVAIEANLDARAVASAAPRAAQPYRLQLDGLDGGHSGIDIHKPRAHAIRQLLALLPRLGAESDFPLIQLQGGTVFNALPRSAFADLALTPAQHAAIAATLADHARRLQQEYPRETPSLTLAPSPEGALPEQALAASVWRSLLRDIHALPFGVSAMSRDFPGVVETSNNLAPLRIAPRHCRCSLLARSQDDAARDALAENIVRQIRASGGTARCEGAYPGWKPNPASTLLQQARLAYQQTFGRAPRLEVIHAGLECGLFALSHPHLEMISFGPDIRGAHAPGECVDIASVGDCWRLLRRLLDTLSTPER
ncbi:MAG: beta-Ala-His dipeptidase [Zoogloeaceae bacterium]|jgi:dipeptidase D|nr:beta-Ala-His dipeptidase [Zoogloeaceae bacterium]